MLIDTVLIVLRETLEAGVLISVLLVLVKRHQLGVHTIFIALAAGLLGATIYALSLREVSEWFEYTGQEVTSALLQYTIYFFLLTIITLTSVNINGKKCRTLWLSLVIQASIALALTREGAELIVLYSGYLGSGNTITSTVVSGFLGLGIGSSVGVLIYYLFRLSNQVTAYIFLRIALGVIACGMVLQATQLLIQADWLSGGNHPVWNSNWLIDENSIFGQLCYAIAGYEATPSPIEIILYSAALTTCLALPWLAKTALTDKSKAVSP